MEPSDEALMNDIIYRKAEAYGVLVQRYMDQLFFFAHRQIGNRADAEDVVQNAFLKIWERPKSWNKNKGSLKSWIFTVVANACRDSMRKNKIRHHSDRALDHIIDLQPLPDKIAEDHSQLDYVITCIHQLPERQRTALYLSVYDMLTYQEIAAVMQISVPAVESLLSRARATLKEMTATQETMEIANVS